jgi:uncharacterized membrane protein
MNAILSSARQNTRSDLAARPPVNVGSQERIASLFGGGLLMLYGLSRGTSSGLALGLLGAGLVYRGATGRCHTYQALGISSAQPRERTSIPSGQGVMVEESVTILRPANELYAFWRKLENLPQVMQHLVSVREIGTGRSHWVAKGPVGNVEWDAEIISEREGELIGWRSLEGSAVATAGSVHFNSVGDRGTEVKVVLSYNPPAGQVGAAIAWLTGNDPKTEIREDLRCFKRLMETGMASRQPAAAAARGFSTNSGNVMSGTEVRASALP